LDQGVQAVARAQRASGGDGPIAQGAGAVA
jgi:hypothetical protein